MLNFAFATFGLNLRISFINLSQKRFLVVVSIMSIKLNAAAAVENSLSLT